MTPEEEEAWGVVVRNPLIRAPRLAREANITLEEAKQMLARIGTPRAVLRAAVKKQGLHK